MLEELIVKLRNRNKQEVSPKSKEEIGTITITKENNFYKLIIPSEISFDEYINQMKLIDNYGLIDLIPNDILIKKGSLLRITSGVISTIIIDNRLYNIIVNEEEININEREKVDSEIIEKSLTVNKKEGTYQYASLKHRESGTTFFVKFYPWNDCACKELTLTEDEFIEETSTLLSNLENIEGINDILNLERIKNVINGKETEQKRKIKRE